VVTTTATPTSAAAGAGAVLIPVDTVRNLDIDAKLAIGMFTLKTLTARDVTAELKAKNGVVRLDPTSAKLFGGSYNGAMTLDATGSKPKISVKEVLEGVQIAEAMNYALPDKANKWLTGIGSVDADVTTTGNDSGELTRGLNGLVKLTVRDGAIEGVSARKLLQQAKALYSGKPYSDDGSPNRTKIIEMNLDTRLVNGVAITDDIKVDTLLVDVGGSGQANLVTEMLDYKLKLGLAAGMTDKDKEEYKKLDGKSLPLLITGSFADPKIKLDVQAAAKDEAIDKATEKLEKKYGDKYGEEIKGLKKLFGK